MKIVMVKDPSGVERPFIQLWVRSAADHEACPMSQGNNKEVKSEKMEEVEESRRAKIPGKPEEEDKEEKETRQMTPKRRRGKEDQTSLENIFKWNLKHTNIEEEKENIHDHDKETSHKSIKKKKEKKILTYNCKEEITPAIIKLLTRSYKVKKDKVVVVEKEESKKREESSRSSSAWRGPRPAPSEVLQARRARPAGEPAQGTGAQEEKVRYCFNTDNQIER
jgi:hypothetical protein